MVTAQSAHAAAIARFIRMEKKISLPADVDPVRPGHQVDAGHEQPEQVNKELDEPATSADAT